MPQTSKLATPQSTSRAGTPATPADSRAATPLQETSRPTSPAQVKVGTPSAVAKAATPAVTVSPPPAATSPPEAATSQVSESCEDGEATRRLLTVHLKNAQAARRRRFGSPNRPAAPPLLSPRAQPQGDASAANAQSGLWATTEKRRLQAELESLREVYARKLADTEISCDRKVQEAEVQREEWFRAKKVEVAKIRAGVVVMQALFERRKKRFLRRMQDEQADFEKKRQQMTQELEQARLELKQVQARLIQEAEEKKKHYELALKEAKAKQLQTEERASVADRKVRNLEEELKRCGDKENEMRGEIEDLHQRLQEAQRAEELQRAREQLATADLKIKEMRRKMEYKKNVEAAALRREIMEYVKFIVKILPDEWRAQLQPQLMQRLRDSEGMRGATAFESIPLEGPPSPSALPPLSPRGR